MFCLGRASLVFSPLKFSVSLRLFASPLPSSVFTTPRSPLRTLSTMAESEDDLFNFTSGRWVYNEALRQRERRLAFDVDGLCGIAVKSVNQNSTDIISFSKLAEGGFNRTFVITLRGGRQMVARVPFPLTVPKYYAIASEVATSEYLRSHGIPTPKIYGYSTDSNNAAGTPYILMEFVQGSKLSEVWPSLSHEEVISVVRQLTQLEAKMMSLPFPAGGSLYFTEDLEKVAKGLGVPLEDERFCVGPDTKLALWYGRRAELDVDRGPYRSAEATLAAAAHKEMAYLRQFGKPLLPLQREKRPAYKFQPQSPSYHIENLERYLDIMPSLVPSDPALSRFCIRHPDFQPNNVFVSRSLDSGCKVVSLFDWQHTSILPVFLQAGIPQRLQNHEDDVPQSMTPPSLPENFNELNDGEQARQDYLYRRRLVHYQYVSSTNKYNQLHYAAFTDRLYALRGRLFMYSGAPWEGESSDLKDALIEATKEWKELASGGVPCPFEFDVTALSEATVLNEELSQARTGFNFIQSMCGIGEEGWVATEDYESAMAKLKSFKEDALQAAESEKERQEIMAHWPWDDMDEDAYM